jgi:hypothetical protein
VTTGKFIASLFGRLYIGNINDSADVDSNSKIIISGFDDNGVPTPHIFPSELFFYVGGSDKYGAITGMATLNGELIIFKRNATYKFTPAGGRSVTDTALSDLQAFSLVQMDENIGCVAAGTIRTVGNSLIFLSEYGVYAFNGASFQYIGGPIEQDLKNVNFTRKELAQGVFHSAENEYWLSLSSDGSNHNDVCFVYDISNQRWYPPYTNMLANVLSNFKQGEEEKILSGDHQGYLYELDKGTSDGVEIGFNVIPTTIQNSGTILNFADGSFPIAGDGLLGLNVLVTDGPGVDDQTIRMIVDATGSQITVTPQYGTGVTTATTFSIGGIDSFFRTKDFAVQSPDLDKLHRAVTVRAQRFGDFNFKMNYILDFNEFSRAGTATISQFNSNTLTWDVTQTSWDNSKWGPAKNKINNVSLRFLPTQPLVGKYFALRFSNKFANQPYEVFNVDIVAKVVGRRT